MKKEKLKERRNSRNVTGEHTPAFPLSDEATLFVSAEEEDEEEESRAVLPQMTSPLIGVDERISEPERETEDVAGGGTDGVTVGAEVSVTDDAVVAAAWAATLRRDRCGGRGGRAGGGRWREGCERGEEILGELVA